MIRDNLKKLPADTVRHVRDSLFKAGRIADGRKYVLDWLETQASLFFECPIEGTLFDCNLLDAFLGLNQAIATDNCVDFHVKLTGCKDEK